MVEGDDPKIPEVFFFSQSYSFAGTTIEWVSLFYSAHFTTFSFVPYIISSLYIIHPMDTINKWCLENPWVIITWSKWRTLMWKAIIMRKRSVIISILEILIPVFFSFQIRLIFEPLALNLQQQHRYTRSDILASLPHGIKCHYAPQSVFSDELISLASSMLKIKITPATREEELVMSYYAKNKTTSLKNVIWIIFGSTEESKPEVLNYVIRGEERDDTPHGPDSYIANGFIAIQTAIEYSFVQMWKSKESTFTGEKLTIGQFPHYHVDLFIMPSAVRPNVSLIYYMTVVSFLLIPMAALHKAIHEKRTGFKALMSILKITPTFIYIGWVNYLIITAIPAAIICTKVLDSVYLVADMILCIFFLMYIIMSAFFIFAVGTFFNHSIKAVLTGCLLWMSLAHGTVALDEFLIESPLPVKIALLFFPHSGLLYGLESFTSRSDIEDFMDKNSRPSFGVIREQKMHLESTKVSLGYIFFAWSLHILAWYYIAVYLDHVHPGGFSTRRPWHYPCREKPKVPDDINITIRGTTNWSAVERPPKFAKPKVRVKKITMDFGFMERREVLKDMSIDFYPNEFTVILGHNGAGKSTLLKIISGMYQATYGNVYVEGRDYSDTSALEELRYRSNIGYCPQENVLLQYLSTFEQLYLFGMIKGLGFMDARAESKRLLQLLKLEMQKNVCINKLTYGAKRRLCLAMALIGPSEVLILDEPTYGVDPQHKKQLWEILATVRRKKTVIMATNAMEAADALADRIAIIANNRIECYGSKSYINRRYGIGYELSLVTEFGCDIDKIKQLIQEYSLMGVQLRGKMGAIVRFNVSRNTQFPALLSILDTHKHELKIRSITLDTASIEGQFRRIGILSQFKERGAKFPHGNHEWIIQKRRRDLVQTRIGWVRLSGGALWRQQIGAIFYKKLMHAKASWSPYLFSIIFAIITLILTITVTGSSESSNVHSPEIELNVGQYGGKNLFILVHVADDSESQNYFSALQLSTEPLGEDNFHQTDNVTTLSIVSHPELHAIEFRDRYFMAIDIMANDRVEITYSPLLIHSGPISLNLFHNALLKYSSDHEGLEIRLKSQPIIDPDKWQYRIVHQKSVRNWENSAVVTTLFLLLPMMELGIQEARSTAKHLQFNTSGITVLTFWIPAYCIDFFIYFVSVFIITTGTFAAYRHIIQLSTLNIVRAIFIISCYGAVAILMGYCVQLWSHRSGTVYTIILLINLIPILVINPEVLFPLIMYHVGETVRMNLQIISHIFPPYTLACAIGNFIAMSIYNTECSEEHSCNTTFAIEDPCCRNCGDEFCYRPLDVLTESEADLLFAHSIADDILIMIAQACFFFMILVLFELKNRRKWRSLSLREETIKPTDEDLIAEKNFIENLIRNYESNIPLPQNVTIIVKGLSKKYGNKEVLREINLRINDHECYGLMGMNGAGKTTIFQTLTGQIRADNGKAIIHGVDMASNDDEYYGSIGYCPQNDGLIYFLTGRQSLQLFAAIRGIPYKHIRDEVDRWLDVFDLLEFENLKLKECPWGVRRKISVLQSLIGDLPLIFLDEPSTGMDIIARSALAETLYQVREMGATIFFTTHNINEAEALCNDIGILVDGQLISTGTCERLIVKHGDKRIITIMLSVETSAEAVEAIKLSMATVLPFVEFIERYLDILFFQLLEKVSFYHVYENLEIVKQKHPAITDYFINQQSLERVYEELTRRKPLIHLEKAKLWQRFFHRVSEFFREVEDL